LLKGCGAAGFGVPNALINSSEGRLVFVIHHGRLLFEFKFLSLGHSLMLAPNPARCKSTRGQKKRTKTQVPETASTATASCW
jgi:hypothetical protein